MRSRRTRRRGSVVQGFSPPRRACGLKPCTTLRHLPPRSRGVRAPRGGTSAARGRRRSQGGGAPLCAVRLDGPRSEPCEPGLSTPRRFVSFPSCAWECRGRGELCSAAGGGFEWERPRHPLARASAPRREAQLPRRGCSQAQLGNEERNEAGKSSPWALARMTVAAGWGARSARPALRAEALHYFCGAGLGLVVGSKSSVRKGVTGRPCIVARLQTGLSAHA